MIFYRNAAPFLLPQALAYAFLTKKVFRAFPLAFGPWFSRKGKAGKPNFYWHKICSFTFTDPLPCFKKAKCGIRFCLQQKLWQSNLGKLENQTFINVKPYFTLALTKPYFTFLVRKSVHLHSQTLCLALKKQGAAKGSKAAGARAEGSKAAAWGQRKSKNIHKLPNLYSPCCRLTSPTTFVSLFHRYSELNEPKSSSSFDQWSKASEARGRKLAKLSDNKSRVKVGLTPKYPVVYSILGEFKYRVLYIGLITVSLLLLLYLNIGLYLEFQSSYYLNYYQFIDFNWSEGIKELNQNNVYPNENTVQPSHYKESSLDKKADAKKIGTPIAVEIDEFKFFFISMVSYFSEQMKFLVDFSGKNTCNLGADTSQQLVFSVYMMSLFYQLVVILGYHSFCFLCPAVIKQYRLKILMRLKILFLILLLHFIALPYILTVYQELQIESLDSELFFSAHFDFLESWIKCFYFLLMVITLIALIMFFYYPF